MRLPTCFLLILAHLPPAVSAAIIANETFEGTNFLTGASIVGVTSNSPGVVPFNQFQITAGTLESIQSANPLVYSGGVLQINGGSRYLEVDADPNGAVGFKVNSSFTTASTYYFSVLVEYVGAFANDTTRFGMGTGVADALNNSPYVGTQDSGLFRAALGGTATTGATITPGAHFLVAKVTSDGANWVQTDLWIDPTSDIEVPATLTQTGTFTSASNFGFFILRWASADAGDLIRLDEIRLGTSFTDVVPVPEPIFSGLAMGGALAALLVSRRVRPTV